MKENQPDENMWIYEYEISESGKVGKKKNYRTFFLHYVMFFSLISFFLRRLCPSPFALCLLMQIQRSKVRQIIAVQSLKSGKLTHGSIMVSKVSTKEGKKQQNKNN